MKFLNYVNEERENVWVNPVVISAVVEIDLTDKVFKEYITKIIYASGGSCFYAYSKNPCKDVIWEIRNQLESKQTTTGWNTNVGY
jgi:hypothetical protein